MLNYTQIGQNLANLRKNSMRTQLELSEILNVSHQAVSKWERGVSLPDIEMLVTLSKVYTTSIEELLNLDIPIAHSEPINSIEIDSAGIWVQALKIIQSQLSKPSFDTWFKPTTSTFDGHFFTIFCQSTFAKEWLDTRYSKLISTTIEQILGNPKLKIAIEVADSTHIEQRKQYC